MRVPAVMSAMLVLASVFMREVLSSSLQLHQPPQQQQQWLQQRLQQLEQHPLQVLHRMKRWRFWPFSKKNDAEVVTTTPKPTTTTTTTTTTAAPRERGSVERTVGGFWSNMFPITSIIERNYERIKNSTLGRAIRNSTVGRAFSRGKNATSRGVVFISREVSSGARRVGQAVRAGYRKIKRRLTGEQKYRHFIEKVKEGVENGDENTLSMLDRLGINVDIDASGATYTSVKNNTPTFTEILENEGLLNRNGSNVPISTSVPTPSHALHDTNLEEPLNGEATTGNGIESGTSNEPEPSSDEESAESNKMEEAEESDEEDIFHDVDDGTRDESDEEYSSTTWMTPMDQTLPPVYTTSPTTKRTTLPPVHSTSSTSTTERTTLPPVFATSPTPQRTTLPPVFATSPAPQRTTLPPVFATSPTQTFTSNSTEFYYPFPDVGLENIVSLNESVTDDLTTMSTIASAPTLSPPQPSSSNTTEFETVSPDESILDFSNDTALPDLDRNSSSELGSSSTDRASTESFVLPDPILTTEREIISLYTTERAATTTTSTPAQTTTVLPTAPPPPPTTTRPATTTTTLFPTTTTTLPPTTTTISTTTTLPPTTTTTSTTTTLPPTTTTTSTTTTLPPTTTTTSTTTTLLPTTTTTSTTTTTLPPTTTTTSTTTTLPPTTTTTSTTTTLPPTTTTTSTTTTLPPTTTTTSKPTTTPPTRSTAGSPDDEFPPPGGNEEDAEFPSPFGSPGGGLPDDEDGFPDVFSDHHVRDRLRDIYERGDFSHDDLKNAFNFNPHDYHYYYDYE